MKIDFEKIGVITSYLAENTNKLYVTKLLKLFYYIDFISYNQRGASVTNDIYYKLPYGPVPSVIKNEIDNLDPIIEKSVKSQLSKFISLEKNSDVNTNGRLVKNINKNYDLRKLSNYELSIIKLIVKKFKNTTSKEISEKTHREKPWQLSSINSVINYDFAKELDVKKILPEMK